MTEPKKIKTQKEPKQKKEAGIQPQDVSGLIGKAGSLVQSGFSLADSISNIIDVFTNGNNAELQEIREKRWVLGLVDSGRGRLPGSRPDGLAGDDPIPGLARYVPPQWNIVELIKNSKALRAGKVIAIVYNGDLITREKYHSLLNDYYGNHPELRIRAKLINSGDLPSGYSAENIRKLINPPIGHGAPTLPVGWTELVAVREGFSGEVALANSRLRAASVAARGADAQDRKILETKVQTAALLARESKQASNDIQRILTGLPVGI